MATASSTVLVVGAGPAGLTLACDLRRRGIDVRVVAAAAATFPGSRAKGIQPRTQEVFDDLGVLDSLVPLSTTYPPLGLHLEGVDETRPMIDLHEVTERDQHPNTLLIGQYDTDQMLLRRFEALGGAVEFNTTLTWVELADDGVVVTLDGPGGIETTRAEYVVGADGGASATRTILDIAFDGTTDETDRMIVADLVLASDLARDVWHVWPGSDGQFMALCPMPGGELFQLMAKIEPDEQADVTPEALTARIQRLTGSSDIHVSAVRWSSVWRPNIRIAEQYRNGHVFLVGDAAHVHPPTGAQGLNTGVQDAYNLGWKLGQVLDGAPDGLLDTYEDERQPIAAGVLGLASMLYDSTRTQPQVATKRGDEERQLLLSYRGGPLAVGVAEDEVGLRAGDRAPNVNWTDASGERQRLIDHLRGPHFTLVAIGAAATEGVSEVSWPDSGASLHTVSIPEDWAAHVAQVLEAPMSAQVLIRPDGYVAYVATADWAAVAAEFAALALPA